MTLPDRAASKEWATEVAAPTFRCRKKNKQVQINVTIRRNGKPRQAVEVSGGIVHAHTVYRDPRLAALSPEELQALDALTKKLALPAPQEAEAHNSRTDTYNQQVIGGVRGDHRVGYPNFRHTAGAQRGFGGFGGSS